MENNQEIISLLKTILEKVERLEQIYADNISIDSGNITIHCGDNGTIEIENAEEVSINNGEGSINIDTTDELNIDAPNANDVSVSCDGSIEGDVIVNSESDVNVDVECHGDIEGDVFASNLTEDE